MNTTDSSPHPATSPGWRLFGELELPAASGANATIQVWLVDMLASLHLRADFVERLLNSALEAAVRILQSNTGSSIGHIHLSIFAPNEIASPGSTWGFFRIEKIDSTDLGKDHPDHAVEFYLYPEGK